MDDGKFQWDDKKAADNYADHGVRFEVARAVFNDPFALEWLDRASRLWRRPVQHYWYGGAPLAVCLLYDERREDASHFRTRG